MEIELYSTTKVVASQRAIGYGYFVRLALGFFSGRLINKREVRGHQALSNKTPDLLVHRPRNKME
ncbi:MAG: hypothetical protein OXE49_19965 [Gemmatimonadetes bacterium]|nr:hypothetical protein [Gemmatimonadota bacterium]